MSGALEQVQLSVNGVIRTVRTDSVDGDLSLARYLRDYLTLPGTKISCGQGGCGACIVTAVDQSGKTKSVNSCLTPILSCDGWSVTTVEGLGGKEKGFHPVQERLAQFHGTQCGFCSPGMVMSMNSLRESTQGEPDVRTIENVLDGNICRCTGYRPILDAFKSFAPDAPEDLKRQVSDIEDLARNGCGANGANGGAICPQTKAPCKWSEQQACNLTKKTSNHNWFQPRSMEELRKVIKELPEQSVYRLVAGNTGTGIYDIGAEVDTFVEVNSVGLDKLISKRPLAVGAGMTINDFIVALRENSDGNCFGHQMAKHLGKVANVSVRNRGTLAGNLMLKHSNPAFPSDVFVLLEAIGAEIAVMDVNGTEQLFGLEQWLAKPMDKKILTRITLPDLPKEDYQFTSFKVTPRSQNAHAYVNAAFLAKIKKPEFVFEEAPRIVFGGISPSVVHSEKAEAFLKGQKITGNEMLQEAMAKIDQDARPNDSPILTDVAYRKHLMKALFYKFVLSVLGDKIDPGLQSGGSPIIRGISKGSQNYETDPDLFPINQPIGKLEGNIQCSGEAEYVDDIPSGPRDVHGAFVISDVGNCELDLVDPKPALDMQGVLAFFDHNDIPGSNHCGMGRFSDEVFSSGKIHYAGQAIGIIVAETHELALKAAKMVKVTYKNHQKPVLTLREAIKSQDRMEKTEEEAREKAVVIGEFDPFVQENLDQLEDANGERGSIKKIEGEFEIGSQMHFHLEQHTCYAKPIEDGQFEVYPATQWIEKTGTFISNALKIPLHNFDMKVRRLGGAYGGKIAKCNQIAIACTLAAQRLARPVRVVLDIKTNLSMVGRRLPFLAKYKAVASAETGKLKAVGIKMYCDCGYNFNTPTVDTAKSFAQNVYSSDNWRIIPNAVVTNTPSHTWCRAPGSPQGHAMIEMVLEHMAKAIGMDPLEFREKNVLKAGDKLIDGKTYEETNNPATTLLEIAKVKAKYGERLEVVRQFNKENRWKKRGLSLIPVRYVHNYFGTKYHVHISIYADDGTIAVSHGGIEMGQGINTKVAQVIAKELQVPISIIKIKSTSNLIGPNNTVTGGSMGSECCASAAQLACEDLKKRMKKVKDTLPPTASWLDLVKECDAKALDLSARHMGHPDNDGIQGYTVWGAVATEVEVDVLTGELNIRRTDLVEDTGTAISPEIDVGQIEGGYIMGLGMWTTEEIKYDPESGKLLTNDTWEYKPPASQDIPEDLRTTFYNSGRNPGGVLGSKATGEPSVLMGVGVIFAIRNALDSVKKDLGRPQDEWYTLNAPATVENIQTTSGVSSQHFLI